jgi:glutamyl-tRNA synthetase
VSDIRVRFCPSPTGNPHVGMVRTALFNWAFARHTGGTFVFRIEDTDSARDSEESYEALLEALRWLGLDWDEGPEVGGPYGPYRQSQRRESYTALVQQLLDSGRAYECFCSPEELEERRKKAMEEKRAPGYDGHCRELSADQRATYRGQGREAVVRFRMPDRDYTWNDLIRGEITFAAGQVPDYVVQRANGEPLYTLVNPADDAAMRITHVLRGEDLLSSTPRQIALYEAMIEIGAFAGPVPQFGHLPYVMGEGNKKLSKRDPESSLQMYRDEGFLPEGLLNYLALLGWSPGGDVEFFSKQQMAEAFTLERVNPNPARFDLKKCTAINGDWIRSLGADELVDRLLPYLIRDGVLSDPPSPTEVELVRAVVPLISERMETLGQASGMVGFLFVQDVVVDPDDAEKILGEEAEQVLGAAHEALTQVTEWSTEAIEGALRAALIDGLGLKPKVAFGPVRLAITGRRVSPPLFESMELLGRETSLARIAALRGA